MNSKEVEAVFGDLVDYIIKGKAGGGVSSTIVDLTGPEVKIVREGPLSREDILKALEE